MAATGKSADIWLNAKGKTVFLRKLVCSPGIQENRAFGMWNIVLAEFVTRLRFGTTTAAYCQRIIVAAAIHILLADPRVEFFSNTDQVSLNLLAATGLAAMYVDCVSTFFLGGGHFTIGNHHCIRLFQHRLLRSVVFTTVHRHADKDGRRIWLRTHRLRHPGQRTTDG